VLPHPSRSSSSIETFALGLACFIFRFVQGPLVRRLSNPGRGDLNNFRFLLRSSSGTLRPWTQPQNNAFNDFGNENLQRYLLEFAVGGNGDKTLKGGEGDE
jgi:hypothetical protein